MGDAQAQAVAAVGYKRAADEAQIGWQAEGGEATKRPNVGDEGAPPSPPAEPAAPEAVWVQHASKKSGKVSALQNAETLCPSSQEESGSCLPSAPPAMPPRALIHETLLCLSCRLSLLPAPRAFRSP